MEILRRDGFLERVNHFHFGVLRLPLSIIEIFAEHMGLPCDIAGNRSANRSSDRMPTSPFT
jgi:hypothetical protein